VDDATGGSAADPAGEAARAWPGTRGWFAVAALVLAVACLVPPVSTLAGRYALAETVQFACFAMVIPGLLVLGAPWRLLGLAGRGPAPHPDAPAGNTGALYTAGRNAGVDPGPGRPADRLARGRELRPAFMRSVAFLAAFAALAVAWRLPPVIDAVARHPGLAVAELASLLITGVALWLELVPSPPFRPRGRNGLHLAVIAAFAMWLIWIIAYILGMANQGVFHAYHYHPGGPLSAVADQELATAVLWAVAAVCFMPVIFISAHAWLHDGDDVEAELEQVTEATALPAVKGWAPQRRRKAST
jgi:cytochrome c oxidase assembly factor CtaG